MENNNFSIYRMPELAIVDINDLILHEKPSDARTKILVKKIHSSGQLKNPPIVARIAGISNFVVIDGANRIAALRRLKVESILVQVIDMESPNLELRQWHHVLNHQVTEGLLKFAHQISGLRLELCDSEKPTDFLFRIQLADGGCILASSDWEIGAQLNLLNQFMDYFLKRKFIDRVSYDDVEYMKSNYSNFSALISYRQIDKVQLVEFIRKKLLLPSGITRFILPNRVLNCNFELDGLRSGSTALEKTRLLEDWLNKKMKTNSIRLYYEPTFHFDN